MPADSRTRKMVSESGSQSALLVAGDSMAEEAAILTYSIAQPFQQALKAVRRVLTCRGLELSGELDVAGRLRQKLGIGTAPCVVLLASIPGALADAIAADPFAAGLVPIHVVVSSRAEHSEIHVLGLLPMNEDSRAMAAVKQIQTEVLQAVEKISMRAILSA